MKRSSFFKSLAGLFAAATLPTVVTKAKVLKPGLGGEEFVLKFDKGLDNERILTVRSVIRKGFKQLK